MIVNKTGYKIDKKKLVFNNFLRIKIKQYCLKIIKVDRNEKTKN